MLIAVLSALLAAIGLYVIYYGMNQRTSRDVLEDRLALLTERQQDPTSLREVELSAPLLERLLTPIMDKLSSVVTRRTSAGSISALQAKLDLAGSPLGLTVGGFILFRIASLVLFFGLAWLVVNITNVTSTTVLFYLGAGIALGYFFPLLWLRGKISGRQKAMLVSLPTTMDLLTISVEAGLGFDAALTRVVEKYKNPLTDELSFVLNEIRLGRPRLEALEEMGARSRVDDINTFIQSVVQSEQLGVGIANTLRIQSEEVRRRRRQRAEELGAKAPLKMLFPMVGCIFPVIFIILLGPAAIQIAHQFAGK